jgi:acetyl coenzyme A synthetase (ADP forming)-like protein
VADTETYPAVWEGDVVLADGGTVHLRPIRHSDGPLIQDLHSRLSPETVYRRFFSPKPELPPDLLEYLVHVDYVDRMAVVAVLGERIIAVARYDRFPGSSQAEVAFVVDDAHQGRGLGTLMLEHLVVIARTRGISRFVAETLPENQAMLAVFLNAGFEVSRRFGGGLVDVEFPIAPTPQSERAADDRDRSAVAHSIGRLLRPRSVAVIGASREPGTIGHELVRNLLAAGFQGPVLPVNSRAAHVAGVYAFPTLDDIPIPVDLAVVSVPADAVEDVVAQCARKGVTGLIVISAGFGETGAEGRAAERRLVDVAHGNGMRMIGPNCMGVVNTNPGVRLNATFAPTTPALGRVGFLSQSGALGIAVLAEADARGLGVSTFVSVGNKADVSGNDLLLYWEDDPDTDVILLYLESFGNPRKFARIAPRIAQRKPIVIVKGGRTGAGARAASSHTAAMASPDAVVDALFRQAGVTRVNTLEQLFDVAQAFAHQPLPAGKRVAIVGNGGGPGILAADAAEGAGLQVPELAESTQEQLRSFLPPAAAVRNPVDIVASGSPEALERSLAVVLDDDGVDAVVAVYVPPLPGRDEEMIAAIGRASAARPDKPVLANLLAGPTAIEVGGRRVPVFRFPESAVLALARMAELAAWRGRSVGVIPPADDLDHDGVRAIVDAHLSTHPEGGWLPAADGFELMNRAGIPVVPAVRATSAAEAAKVADSLGYPVALKGSGSELIHKTELGAVRLDLANASAVTAAVDDMRARLGDRLESVIVQPMVPRGVELIAGITHDESFGPLVLVGAGGTTAELLADRTLHLTPLTDADASRMIRSLRSAPLLFGFRGAEPADVDAVERLLIRLGQLGDRVPEIAELDANPVIVGPSGLVVVDVRVRIEHDVPHPERALRRLLNQ